MCGLDCGVDALLVVIVGGIVEAVDRAASCPTEPSYDSMAPAAMRHAVRSPIGGGPIRSDDSRWSIEFGGMGRLTRSPLDLSLQGLQVVLC